MGRERKTKLLSLFLDEQKIRKFDLIEEQIKKFLGGFKKIVDSTQIIGRLKVHLRFKRPFYVRTNFNGCGSFLGKLAAY